MDESLDAAAEGAAVFIFGFGLGRGGALIPSYIVEFSEGPNE